MKQKALDIIFLGGLFPKETEDEIISNSKGSIQYAANALQWNMVEGLDANMESPIKIINSIYIGSFPRRYKNAIIKNYEFHHDINSRDINVGYLNLAGIKHLMRYISLRPYLKAWAQDNNKDDKVIIAYALTNVFVRSLKYIKKINPNIVTIIIVPDLPQYMDTTNTNNSLYNALKTISISDISKNIKYVDGLVLLTNHMKEKLNILQQKTVVIEGISSNIFDEIQAYPPDSEIKTIVYTGSLHERYGVLNLLEAFSNISNSNYRLLLCGDGDSREKIIERTKYDNRITYCGLLKRESALMLQLNATVLINPRQNNEIFTRYSFPSKILEYLSSGRPVITYKLDGIPDEYDSYIYYVKGQEILDLTNMIIEVCEKSAEELTEFGKEAKEFVLREKNSKVQAKKIIELCNEIIRSIDKN